MDQAADKIIQRKTARLSSRISAISFIVGTSLTTISLIVSPNLLNRSTLFVIGIICFITSSGCFAISTVLHAHFYIMRSSKVLNKLQKQIEYSKWIGKWNGNRFLDVIAKTIDYWAWTCGEIIGKSKWFRNLIKSGGL